MSIFEKASKQKLRFAVGRGYATTEDLWDLSLPDLNIVAKNLSKAVAESGEESFIEEKNLTDTKTELMFDVVKHVIKVKLDRIKINEKAAVTRAKRTELDGLIYEKENEVKKNMSLEDLQKLRDEL